MKLDVKLATELVEKCSRKWGMDRRVTEFINRIDGFFDNLNHEQARIFLELLDKFEYISRCNTESFLEQVYSEHLQDMIENHYTILSVITSQSGKINSSDALLSEFKYVNEIANNSSYQIENLSIDAIEKQNFIIFFDDIIGSGQTFIDFVNRNIEKMKVIECYLICIVIMEDALGHLNKYIEENKLKIRILYKMKQRKAFDENYLFGDDYKLKLDVIRELESQIWGNPKNINILGRNNTQSLVAFFRNTPNNTISSIWYDRETWRGLFRRIEGKGLNRKNYKKNIGYNTQKYEK